jgi:glucose/arabinose dehydrogenase
VEPVAQGGILVAFIPFSGAKAQSGPKEFLTGFMLAPEKREVWGAQWAVPTPDGSLLVSDDGGNKVWRISYKSLKLRGIGTKESGFNRT